MEIDAKKLNYLRKSKDISQEELASRLGIEKQNVSNWERGTKRIPIKYHDKICKILNAHPEELCLEIPIPMDKAQAMLKDLLHESDSETIIRYYNDPKNKIERLELLLKIAKQCKSGSDAIQPGELRDNEDGKMGFRSKLKIG
jgi:transcriptional regulator with XRE-family HTH domain